MATIRKRGDSYQIRVSCGYTTDGKQVEQSLTWKPDKNMTQKQIEKELNRQAVIFEEACMNGYMTSAVKFSTFSDKWLDEYAKPNYKKTTLYKLEHVRQRIDEEIGHKRLDKITTRDIQALIKTLTNGNEVKGYKPMCNKTVRNYISYVSSVFEYAIYLNMISRNPCSKPRIPKDKLKKRDIYSLDEAQHFIDILTQKAPLTYQCYFILALFGGFRRGEISGLTWDNIDFDNGIITIEKALYYTKSDGIVLDTPKTETSNRALRLEPIVFDYLKCLQLFYGQEAVRLGTKWGSNNFVFKNETGGVLSPLSPNSWLHKFCKREKLRYVNIHSFRHLNASLLIDSGASVKTVQGLLGHALPSTTINIYAQAFAKSQAKASSVVATNFNLLQPAI